MHTEMAPAMRAARLMVRNGDLHRDGLLVLERLWIWGRGNQARVCLNALVRDLRIGRSQLVALLGRLGELGLLLKQRTRVWVEMLRKYVQGTNVYVLLVPRSESRGGTAHVQEEKNRAREAVDNPSAPPIHPQKLWITLQPAHQEQDQDDDEDNPE